MTSRRFALAALATGAASGCAMTARSTDRAALLAELRAAELGFARSMADRDFGAFSAHVADDAVFINGGTPLRGKVAILAAWRRFFDGPTAPFSWLPEIVEVAADPQLGYTEGPVTAPSGVVFARFFSTWRRMADGRWLIVFDNGTEVCK
jgi:ketosteroid isomerase-like protein